jgi:glutathione S-transferase
MATDAAAGPFTLYHFPGCPYSERVEILLALKGLGDVLEDVEIDISTPRPAWLLEKTRGTTALPALDCARGTLKESVVILRYLDTCLPGPSVAHTDPFRHAIEGMFAALDSRFAVAGYALLRNRDPARIAALRAATDAQYERLDQFLVDYGGPGPFLFEQFGWAEAMLVPLLKRLECLGYYEGYEIPTTLRRVTAWREACLAHPAAQSRRLEEIFRLYYDYSQGIGGGAIPPGRLKSSFSIDPHWNSRPMPPRDKWHVAATDRELGLA